MGPVCVSLTPFSSSTGISPIGFTVRRHSGVHVTRAAKSVQTGSNVCPQKVSISASL